MVWSGDGSSLMLTNFWANTVLSLSGKCSSSANTTQLAMIVNNTAYSKGGHSMMNRVYFLIGLSSVRINNDVGPPPGGFSSFFGPPILSAKRWAPFRPKCPPPKESCWCPASTASWAASNLARDTREASKCRQRKIDILYFRSIARARLSLTNYNNMWEVGGNITYRHYIQFLILL